MSPASGLEWFLKTGGGNADRAHVLSENDVVRTGLDLLQIINQCRTLGVGSAFGFEEVGLDHVGVGVLGNPLHAFGLFAVVVVEVAEAEAVPTQVAKVVDVVGHHLAVETGDVVADDVLPPGYLLTNALVHQGLVGGDALGGEELGLFLLELKDEVAEEPEVGVLVAVDVADFLGRTRHLAVAAEVVEEHKSAVEVDALEDVVGNEGLHQREAVLLLLEVVVTVADEGIAAQEVFVGLPLVEDVVALFGAADGVEHVAVTLAVYALLEGLDVQTEIDFVGGDVLTDGRQVVAL